MTVRTRSLLAMTALLCLAFVILEGVLWSKYEHPDHAIDRRHITVPAIKVSQKLFGEYRGLAEIPVTLPASLPELKYFKGVRINTGAYGARVTAFELKILGRDREMLCSSVKPFLIAENNWTAPELRCDVPEQTKFEPSIIRVETQADLPWGVFSGGDGLPAMQLWFDDPDFKGTFAEARNYGGLWDFSALFVLRALARLLIAFGLAYLIVCRREASAKLLLAGFMCWSGLLVGQLAETVSYQNPDETMHAIGAFRSVTSENDWPTLYKSMKDLGAKIQFKETFAQVSHPIIPGRDGEAWVSDDHYFVDPAVRSGIYTFMIRPLATLALASAESLAAVCRDPVMWLRVFLAFSLMMLAGLVIYGFQSFERTTSAWVFLAVSSIPAYMSSYLTIWNYGLATMLGVFFACCLIPEGDRKSRDIFLLLGAILLPVLGEFARSQIFWFVVGPLPVAALIVFGSNESEASSSILKRISLAIFASLMTFVVLSVLLGKMFIPEKNLMMYSAHKICEKLDVSCEFVQSSPLITLFVVLLISWLLAGGVTLVVAWLLNLMQQSFSKSVKRTAKTLIAVILLISLLLILRKCLSLGEVTYLRSLLGLEPHPTFAQHLKEAYRALMSQQFSRHQDYFLIQTFFMAYGWLEVTGHWLVYFVYRNLMCLALIAVASLCVLRPKEFVQVHLPMLMMFFVYLLGIWFGAWTGRFTIVGRFVFPAMGVLYVSLILAITSIVRRQPILDALSVRASPARMFFLYALVNAIYGAFYLLPMRFAVGL
jgi:hypothetical protein